MTSLFLPDGAGGFTRESTTRAPLDPVPLKTFFDRVVIINLNRRQDRKELLARCLRLCKWPFREPEWFEAFDGAVINPPPHYCHPPRGAWGCLLSHAAVIERALADGVNSLFILEDDAFFEPTPAAKEKIKVGSARNTSPPMSLLDRFRQIVSWYGDAVLESDFGIGAAKFLANMPADWEVIMFGGSFQRCAVLPVAPGVVRPALPADGPDKSMVVFVDALTGVECSVPPLPGLLSGGVVGMHAYALRPRAMEALLNLWREPYFNNHIDLGAAPMLAKRFRVYCPDPMLVAGKTRRCAHGIHGLGHQPSWNDGKSLRSKHYSLQVVRKEGRRMTEFYDDLADGWCPTDHCFPGIFANDAPPQPLIKCPFLNGMGRPPEIWGAMDGFTPHKVTSWVHHDAWCVIMPDGAHVIHYGPKMQAHIDQTEIDNARIGPDLPRTLSLCVCSIATRKHFLENLLRIITPQLTNRVELLMNVDNGQISIGEKRQRILERATGDYVACIDDDDEVAPDYVSEILAALDRNPRCHCVGFRRRTSQNGKYQTELALSTRYSGCVGQDGIGISHLCPIRRDLALRAGFPSLNWGEDIQFAAKATPFLLVEEFIDKPLYHYLWRDRITHRPGEVVNRKPGERSLGDMWGSDNGRLCVVPGNVTTTI